MEFEVGAKVTGELRLERVLWEGDGVRYVDARDPRGRAWLALVDLSSAPAADLDAQRERLGRLALGMTGLVRPERALFESGRLIVVYRLDAEDAAPLTPERDPLRAARTVQRAVAGLHDQGVAHGALGPALVLTNGHVVGFGLADLVLLASDPGHVARLQPETSRAPELARGGRPEPPADVFATAALVRTLLTEPLDPDVDALLADATASAPAVRPTDLAALCSELEIALREAAARPAPPGLPVPNGPAPASGASASEVAAPASGASASDVAAPAGDVSAPPSNFAAAPVPQRGPPAPNLAPIPDPRIPTLPRPAPPKASWLPWAFVVLAFVLMAVSMVVGFRIGASSTPRPSEVTVAPTPPPTVLPLPEAPVTPTPTASPADAGGAEIEDSADASVPALVGSSARGASFGPAELARTALAALPLDAQVPTLGAPNAAVTVVVFGDLECVHTRRQLRTLARLLAAHPDDVRLAWRHFPISTHANARGAARVAAGLASLSEPLAFWRFLDAALTSDDPPTTSALTRWAAVTGPRGADVGTWLAAPDTAAAVDRDVALATRLGVRSTPSLFVNGAELVGYHTLAELEQRLAKELTQALLLARSGASPGAVFRTRVDANFIGVER